MSRRNRAVKKTVLPDAKYGDVVVSKFINMIMVDGKKSVAEKIVYGSFDILASKASTDAIEAFHDAIAKVKPQLEVKSRRVGGATYQVPVEVKAERASVLAYRWVIDAARKRSEKTMVERLSGELFDALNSRGASIKKRDDTHKMAEANKAFAHFRW